MERWLNTDNENFIAHVKLEDVYADLAGCVKKRFDTSNYQVQRSLSIGKKKKKIELKKLNGKITKKVIALRPNMYSYLADNTCVDKNEKTQRSVLSIEKLNLSTTKST